MSEFDIFNIREKFENYLKGELKSEFFYDIVVSYCLQRLKIKSISKLILHSHLVVAKNVYSTFNGKK